MNTTYHVTVFDGFTSVTSQVPVIVNARPAIPTVTTDGPTVFCAGGSVMLTSSAGSTYIWSTGETTPGINVVTSGNFYVQVTNASGCKSAASASTEIIVNPLPAVGITSSNSAMCVDDMRTLTGYPAGVTFSLTEGQGIITENILTATGIGILNLVCSYTDVCTNEATQSIVVTEKPVANPGPDQELSGVFETRMNASLSSHETGEWSLVSGTGLISDIYSPTASVTELSVGENIFLWKVGNGSCEVTATVKITASNLFIPSVITPNGDGKNDYFRISENQNQAELIIFNRWGIEEFSDSHYLNDWDGKNNHGEALPNDTYFYILIFDNGLVKKGSVLILR